MTIPRMLFALALIWIIAFSSCYTTLRAPDTGGLTEEIPEQVYHYSSPSVPDSRLEDFDWFYYYQSAWWQDDLMGWGGAGTATSPEPEEYRRRFPMGSQPQDNTIGVPANAPGLSKSADGGTPPPESSPKTDPRRDFNSGSTSSSQPAVQPAAESADSSRRDFQSGSHTISTKEENNPPKRK